MNLVNSCSTMQIRFHINFIPDRFLSSFIEMGKEMKTRDLQLNDCFIRKEQKTDGMSHVSVLKIPA